MLELLAQAPEASGKSGNDVAYISVVVTGSVAILGFVVQLLLAGRQSLRELRALRYRELITLYEQMGRALAAIATTLREFTLVNSVEQARQLNDSATVPDQSKEIRHLQCLLLMHRTSPEVLERLDEWTNVLTDFDPGDLDLSAYIAKVRIECDDLDAALARLYTAAGEHARAALTGTEQGGWYAKARRRRA